jgi:hypothetical protein
MPKDLSDILHGLRGVACRSHSEIVTLRHLFFNSRKWGTIMEFQRLMVICMRASITRDGATQSMTCLRCPNDEK